MARWICKDCGAVVTADKAKFCVSCGGQQIEQSKRISWEQRMAETTQELEDISIRLNDLGDEIIPLMQRRKQLLSYLSGLKQRDRITQEEFHKHSRLFKYHAGLSANS